MKPVLMLSGLLLLTPSALAQETPAQIDERLAFAERQLDANQPTLAADALIIALAVADASDRVRIARACATAKLRDLCERPDLAVALALSVARPTRRARPRPASPPGERPRTPVDPTTSDLFPTPQ